ncbi:Hypothetical Protein FCC1311_060122 [Hondaea fermentalgiana]|uniref:Uncharacterized protein n=1 Tax=Hondaea fermentalgiana TaxID=2315210 RepID=A0A2R5GFT9_9STRA|nr:Hypothetical Protein FCC1311_060122 [Hondaea fermentalgiana]|eukprot:GBG29792.1 Hypothetical Protein FCC1311_060122 [Hondaea fermentalgiana]
MLYFVHERLLTFTQALGVCTEGFAAITNHILALGLVAEGRDAGTRERDERALEIWCSTSAALSATDEVEAYLQRGERGVAMLLELGKEYVPDAAIKCCSEGIDVARTTSRAIRRAHGDQFFKATLSLARASATIAAHAAAIDLAKPRHA